MSDNNINSLLKGKTSKVQEKNGYSFQMKKKSYFNNTGVFHETQRHEQPYFRND